MAETVLTERNLSECQVTVQRAGWTSFCLKTWAALAAAAQILQEEAQKYENRKKIDQGQQYFKEGKYAEKKSEDVSSNKYSKKSADDEPLRGTVEGEGASKKTNYDQEAKNHRYDEPIDVEWREVNSDDTNRGESYVNQFLLEDKKRR